MKNEVSEKYIDSLILSLSLEEKIGMVHGNTLFSTKAVERLGIPSLHFSDGPMGVRLEFADNYWHSANNHDDYASYLPCNSAIASTWNPKAAGHMGNVLGEEARGRGKDVILAPGINIKRSPLCGRNFEYMSEDPRVIEKMVVPMVQEIQKNDVAACVKHFAANSQETERLWVDTIVDERTLHEIYYPGFRAAIKEGGLYSIMGAYNRLNGEHCCTSKALLDGVLRKQWGYDGVIVSDWGGVHDTTLAAEAALDVEMDVGADFDEYYLANSYKEKIISGELSEEGLNEKVRNILRMMYRLKMIGPQKESRKAGRFNTKEHQNATLDVARESVILLKNEEHLLPLNPGFRGRIAVIGANAATIHANGGGSAEMHALYEITPLMGIRMLLGGNAQVRYAPGYYVPKKQRAEISWQATSTMSEEELQATENGGHEAAGQKHLQKQYYEEAVALAKDSDIVIYVGGLNHGYDVEGLDRADMKLPYEQDKLIEALLREKPDTIVVMYAGSPVEMSWLPDAKSLVWSYYAGMEGGKALADVLFGIVNPSGRLSETFLKNLSGCPAVQGVNFGRKDKVEYTEGVMLGYRYYDTHEIPVNFCFGYGLSYTEYVYSNLSVEQDGTDVRVRCLVTNTGAVAGMETVQLYVAPKEKGKLIRPCHELKDFAKIHLEAGETREVVLTLQKKDFSCYDAERKDFVLMSGNYELQIGAASRDIRLKETIQITG